MRAHRLTALALGLGLVAGCGGSTPSAPSPVTLNPGVSPEAVQGIIGATLTQATGLVMTTLPGSFTSVRTIACPAGGSMTLTFTGTLPADLSGPMTSSSRTEYNDCRSQNVTINGDPFLTMTGEHAFGPPVDGIPSSIQTTTRVSGGLRFDAAGTPGRAQYNCTFVSSLSLSRDGPPSLPSVSATGTITWEQPLGTVTTKPCGR